MRELERALEIARLGQDWGGHEIYGSDVDDLVTLLEAVKKRLEKNPTFTVKFDLPGTATGLPFTVFDL